MAKETILPDINVRRNINGKSYSLTFDGMKQSQGYLYFSPDTLLKGFMLHIGLNITDQLNMENIDDFMVAVMNWNNEEKNVKEIARLSSQVSAITNSRVALAKRMITERNRFVKLVDDIGNIANEFKSNKAVRDRLNILIKNFTKTRPFTLAELGVTGKQITGLEQQEQNNENDEDE